MGRFLKICSKIASQGPNCPFPRVIVSRGLTILCIWISSLCLACLGYHRHSKNKCLQLKHSTKVFFLLQLFRDSSVPFFLMLGDKMEGFRFSDMGKVITPPFFKKAFILKTKSVLTQMEIAVKSQTL